MKHPTRWDLNDNTVSQMTYVQEAFTPTQCELIKSLVDTTDLEEAVTLTGREQVGDPKIRKNRVAWLNSGDEKLNWIFRSLTDQVLRINEMFYKFELDYIESLQYTVYNQKDDHYTDHIDLLDNSPHFRKLTFTVQLDDPSTYEGCDLELKYSSNWQPALRDQGSITFFPSYTLHHVTPLKSGVRNSLVGWVCGPRFR